MVLSGQEFQKNKPTKRAQQKTMECEFIVDINVKENVSFEMASLIRKGRAKAGRKIHFISTQNYKNLF